MTDKDKDDDKKFKPVPVLAGGLAAITAAFLGAHLGVAGTITGAGLASIVTTGGAALYEHSLEKTGKTLRQKLTKKKTLEKDRVTVVIKQADASQTTYNGYYDPPTVPDLKRPKLRRLPWPKIAIGILLSFALGMGMITTVELVKGAPISGGNNGTTVTGLLGQSTSTSRTTPDNDTSTTRLPNTTTATTSLSQTPTTTSSRTSATTTTPTTTQSTPTTTPTTTTIPLTTAPLTPAVTASR